MIAIQCEVYLKNGIRLVSSEELVKTVYNNPDVEKVILMRNNKKWTVNLSGSDRLIFFREIKMSSVPEITYNIGFQKTVKGRNVKTIMKILPNDEVIMEGE